ncbi:MAG: response regulator transcription factor [Actinomycetota bacterium]|nr:response regulator transcription factor [Actinomycetota bacterium]
MEQARRIVVVEDDATIAHAVQTRLCAEGFEVHVAGDGPSGLELCERLEPHLVVLDRLLPGLDGLEVCRRVQASRPVPVLMLTALAEETDLLVGLGVGADDYMTKPFSPRELVARVHALLRRVERAQSPPETARIRIGDVEVDTVQRRVRVRGEEVHLTPTEYELLLRLAERPGQVLDRDRLLNDVWGWSGGASTTRTVDSHVRALRRKLGDSVVRTVHGVGYALDTP